MSQVLGLREVHKAGATRVSADGAHILTGGADGVVALFRRKGWPSSSAVWARQCHETAVTCVVLCDALQLALTCGRDGRVLLHENIGCLPAAAQTADEEATPAPTTPSTRAVCQLTGEVRCLSFDAAHKRIFIGGDSLRCLEMSGNKFDVKTYALRVPHPVVSLALSPCHTLLAVASGSSGAVQVTSTNATTTTGATAMDVVLPNLLSPTFKRDDEATCRLDWCQTAGGLFLLVPAVNEVCVLRVVDAVEGEARRSLKKVAVLHGSDGLVDYMSVTSYPLTAHRFACVMASRQGIFVAKVDDRKFAMTRYSAQLYSATPSLALTEVCVQKTTGDTLVALADGQLSLLAKLAPKEGSIEAPPHKTRTTTTPGTTAPARTTAAPHHAADQDDAASSHSSHSSHSSDSSDSDEDDDDEETAEEDLPKVVSDLKRANADFMATHGDEDERPSRWRDEDPRQVLRETARRQPTSRFLDDEADERSASESSASSVAGDLADGEEAEEDGEEEEEEPHYGATTHTTTTTTAAVASTPSALVDYAFQVGATPVGAEGSCFLAYNSVGYIHTAREGTTVHFHDMAQPAVRILERGTILMGTLSPVGAGFVVATTPTPTSTTSTTRHGQSVDDDDAAEREGQAGDVDHAQTAMGSAGAAPRLTVYYRTFVALGAQADWRVRLLPGETVRCMAAGLRFLAVATNRYLRLFSLSGLELAVLSKHSRIVAMVGTTSTKLMSAYKTELDPLAIVYTVGTGELYVEVLDVGARQTLIAAHPLPLTSMASASDDPAEAAEAASLPLHQLQWLGWSEDGPLHTVDTAGVVRLFTESWGGSWVPVYDPRTALDQSDNLWVWGVTDESLLAYRASKNDPPYPAALATGLPVSHVSLCLPLVGGTASSTSSTALVRDRETITVDHLLRRQIRSDELKHQSTFYTAAIAKHDALHDKTLMELFAHAIKTQQTTRAVDLATMLELRDNVEECARTANKQGHVQLARKLLALCQLRNKTKSKRRCPLPLEGSVVSEKERDLVLRKLLAKEKAASGAPVAAAAAAATVTTTTTTPTPPPPREDVVRVETRQPVAVVDPTPTPPRRRVTFSLEPTTSTSTATTTRSTAPVIIAPSPATKAVNPFAKPAPATVQVPEPTLTRTPEKAMAPNSAPVVAASPSPIKSPPAATTRREDEEEGGSLLHSTGAVAARRTSFVAKALPVPVSVAQPRGNSRDPFLVREGESEGETVGVTVDTLLTPQDTPAEKLNPMTASFGEALRKRYRDDDNDKEDDDGVLGHVDFMPPSLVPKVE